MNTATIEKPLTKKQQAEQERKEAGQRLRKQIKPGDTIQVIQRSVSSSGMMRRLSLFVVKNNHLIDITRDVALVTGFTFDRDYWALKVGGCGMDMHFHTVYTLSRCLWPKGYRCTGKRNCQSNDHSNAYGEASREFYDALEKRGEERLYNYHGDPAAQLQHEAMRAYVEEQVRDGGRLGHTKGRVHRDGGYALSHRTV